MGEVQQVLFYSEAEQFVQSLRCFKLSEIGSDQWERQREQVEKLNIQAVVDATNNVEESIKELLISHEKIPVLIHELVTLDLWKRNVFPKLLKMDLNTELTFPSYVVLFYEAILVGLLEVLLYHAECHEIAGDSLHDLLQYCQNKIVWLISAEEDWKEVTEEKVTENAVDELTRRFNKISFDVSLKSIALVRYIGEHGNEVSLGIITRLLNTYDFPSMFASLIDNPPWRRREESGQWLKYSDNNKWIKVTYEELNALSKMEGQVWIGLLQFLMSPHGQQNYKLNTSNQANILKLRSHFNPQIVDQLPVLVDLQRYLEELSLMNAPSSRAPLILEQIPQFYNDVEMNCKGKYEDIAQKHYKRLFCMSKDKLKQQAQRFAATYDMDVMTDLVSEPPRCDLCGELAAKRCSQCGNTWYCGRECQVKDWAKHKAPCKAISSVKERTKENKAQK